MLIEFYMFFEVVMLIIFMIAFFSKHEILWAITLVLSGMLMFTSFTVEYSYYNYNATIGVYEPSVVVYSFPYLMGVNFIFAALSLTLGLFDLFDKYGSKFSEGSIKKKGGQNNL